VIGRSVGIRFPDFYVMLVVLKADERLFQTGWFVESLCTQVL